MTESVYPKADFQAMAEQPSLAQLWTKTPNLLQRDSWPDCQEWQDILDSTAEWQALPAPLKFELDIKIGQRRKRKLTKQKADPLKPALRRYESTIVESQRIPMREMDRHDYFNALIWLHFPKSKYALHHSAYRSYQSGQRQIHGNLRNDLTDALTRFDEGGLVYFASDHEDLDAIRAVFRSRDDLAKADFARNRKSQFAIFGHGLLEVWSKKGRNLTAGLLIVGGEGSWDERLAQYLEQMDEPSGKFGTFVVDGILEAWEI